MGKSTHRPTGPSKTRRDVGIETDMNKIVGKGLNPGSGRLSSGMQGSRVLQYGILLSESYHEMLNHVIDTQHAFRALPARIRARFHNNPEQMLRFLDDPKNKTEAIKLGIINDDPENPVLSKTPEQLDIERFSKFVDSMTPEQLKAALAAKTKTSAEVEKA